MTYLQGYRGVTVIQSVTENKSRSTLNNFKTSKNTDDNSRKPEMRKTPFLIWKFTERNLYSIYFECYCHEYRIKQHNFLVEKFVECVS